MTGRAGQSPVRRRAGLWLALFALAIKAAIAPGYMIGPGEDGRPFTIMPCPGDQIVAAPADPHAGTAVAHGEHGEHGGDGQDGHSDPRSVHGLCPFSGAGAPGLASAEGPTLAMRAEAGRGAAPPTESQAAPALAGPPLAARGPPLRV